MVELAEELNVLKDTLIFRQHVLKHGPQINVLSSCTGSSAIHMHCLVSLKNSENIRFCSKQFLDLRKEPLFLEPLISWPQRLWAA